ncbi:AMP-dependent synthetase/ligase [Rhodococcus sp. T7]|uniref:AMP-dependent synthetase/ligase n=1 Tax=Rhodococcus sp. T7 TaxID=627444 RepID=UPI001356F3E9|nr:AMP-dependent synthetase/ligase [Rhodococcus sp. T7]KAF0957547.1 Long-chain-fatty-acid--CoA ligase FadD15 [Rhodococcus sp. T7]KAF0964457.1 Long-chain-fatty-acid--CoA ligase FadD15 [Rhodococcus sp. T7]
MTNHLDRPKAFHASTLAEAFQLTVREFPEQIAFNAQDELPPLTWSEYAEEVRTAAGVLRALGLRRGDTIAVMFTSRREFHFVDSAALHLGITCFSLYNSASLDAMRFVLENSGARAVITEAAFFDRALELDSLVEMVVLMSTDEHSLLDWATLVERADPSLDLAAAAAEVSPDEVVTLVYTAGTTGTPKGVELTHSNITFAMRTLADRMEIPAGANQLSFLPMAHAMARMMDHYVAMMLGFSISVCGDPARVLDGLVAARPSFFASTPRVWEKLRTNILDAANDDVDESRRAQFRRVIDLGIERVRAEQQAFAAGLDRPDSTTTPEDAALLSHLKRQVGLDRIVSAIVGGAPVESEMVEFFHAIGVPVGEAFGMSESSAVCTANPPSRVRFGTVGPPLDGVTVRLADDGEILFKGANVMSGYRGMPERTAEAIDADGWLHTGDVAQIEEDGYLRIVDRKKDIIINAAGKNMSPTLIQSELTRATRLVNHAVAVGDRRPYNVALLVLDPEELRRFAVGKGLSAHRVAELIHHPEVVAELDAAVAAANANLSRPEQIKRYRVLEQDWVPGGDELTPTLKLKRGAVVNKYATIIDALYKNA